MESNGSEFVTKNYQKYPHEIVSVDQAMEEQILLDFKGPLAGLFYVGPDKWIMPKQFPKCAEKLYNFNARDDDVCISTYPRSGTTWTQEMMWLLCNDLNYEAAKAVDMMDRFPFFEYEFHEFFAHPFNSMSFRLGSFMENSSEPMPEGVKIDLLSSSAVDILPGLRSPRLIKTHLPIKLMPHETLAKGCKIVYVARNPKDVLVSMSYFVRNMAYAYTGFQQLADYFLNDLLSWGPFFEHLKDGWSRRNDSNVLFLFYEDLVMDLKNSLKKLATFLGRPLTDNDLPDLMEHLSIGKFKENNSVNMKSFENIGTGKWNFIRRGQVGGNPEMTTELADRIDAWTDAQLNGTGMKFPHQLRHRIEMYKLTVDKQWKKQSS